MVKLIPLTNTRHDPRRRSSSGISIEARRGKVMLDGKELKRPIVLRDPAFLHSMPRIRVFTDAGLLRVEQLPGTDQSIWDAWLANRDDTVLTVNTPEVGVNDAVASERDLLEDTPASSAEAAQAVLTAEEPSIETPSIEESAVVVDSTANTPENETLDGPVETALNPDTPTTSSEVNLKAAVRPAVRKAIMPRAKAAVTPDK